jgi:acyl-CoA synthetase (AMP-forming)/AMP-acid ligase II
MLNSEFESYQSTMIDMIAALDETDTTIGLFLKKDRSRYSDFFSYRQIYGKILAYMNFFREVGIVTKTKVIFPFESSLEVIISFLALIGLGAIPLSVKPYGIGSTKESYIPFLMRISNQYSTEFILDAPSLKSLEISLKRLPLPPENIVILQSAQFADVTSSDVAFVQFSSGSTSFPKGIPVTHRNIINQIREIVNHSLRRPDDIVATWLPLHHDMGLVGTLLSTLYSKHKIYISTPMSFLMNPVGWLQELQLLPFQILQLVIVCSNLKILIWKLSMI